MTKILMVCLGNICRSPLAEGILKSKLPKDQFVIDSAGTASYHIGSPPDRRAMSIAKKNGLDISGSRGRQFNVDDFERLEYIYVMIESKYTNVKNLDRSEEDHNKVLFIYNETYHNQNYNVPVPYYGGS